MLVMPPASEKQQQHEILSGPVTAEVSCNGVQKRIAERGGKVTEDTERYGGVQRWECIQRLSVGMEVSVENYRSMGKAEVYW